MGLKCVLHKFRELVRLQRKRYKNGDRYYQKKILHYSLPGGSESAHNWKEILMDLKERGVKHIHFIVSDCLSGMKNAIKEIYSKAKQTCVVHVMRNINSKVRVQHRSAIASELKQIFHSKDRKEAEELLEKFIGKWSGIYPKPTKDLSMIKEDVFVYMDCPSQ